MVDRISKLEEMISNLKAIIEIQKQYVEDALNTLEATDEDSSYAAYENQNKITEMRKHLCEIKEYEEINFVLEDELKDVL